MMALNIEDFVGGWRIVKSERISGDAFDLRDAILEFTKDGIYSIQMPGDLPRMCFRYFLTPEGLRVVPHKSQSKVGFEIHVTREAGGILALLGPDGMTDWIRRE